MFGQVLLTGDFNVRTAQTNLMTIWQIMSIYLQTMSLMCSSMQHLCASLVTLWSMTLVFCFCNSVKGLGCLS